MKGIHGKVQHAAGLSVCPRSAYALADPMTPRTPRSVACACLCAMAILASGCPKPGAATEHMTQAPSFAEETGQSKCGVRKSSDKPLVVEWPAADRAALEARATRSLVAVRYEGCEMEVLTSCRALGEYRYLGLTQKREGVRIQNADELYAQLPVGAASLEGKLERAGQLNVDMVIVGRKEADKSEFTERDLEGRCEQATHVITGLTVGAFSFYAGASAELGGSVRVGNVGGGAGSSSEREVLRQDGDESACVAATTGDEVPPPGCGALLRVEVVPIEHTLASRPTSGTHILCYGLCNGRRYSFLRFFVLGRSRRQTTKRTRESSAQQRNPKRATPEIRRGQRVATLWRAGRPTAWKSSWLRRGRRSTIGHC